MLLTFEEPQREREDGLCVNCAERPGTETWCPSGTLGYVHGDWFAWCKVCVLREQIGCAEKAAAELPNLKARLSDLLGAASGSPHPPAATST